MNISSPPPLSPLHVYRNSQDRWQDLRAAAGSQGAVLSSNAVTLDELVRRLTPGVAEASAGQRVVLASTATGDEVPVRYALDALAELKSSRVTPASLRSAGAPALARYLETYDRLLQESGLVDAQDRRWLAASSASESSWLRRFESVTLHALYDLTPPEFALLRGLIETLPEGGTVMLFNATANVRPTQFAEWTWQRFVYDEALSSKTFPEFLRSSGPAKDLLERLFVFDAPVPPEPLKRDESLRIFQCSGRYGEIEFLGGEVADLIASGKDPREIAVVVRHIDAYGEMIEDVFSRYGVDCAFETGVPLLRIPFIKYWAALLDLVSGERPRDAMARVLGSAYYEPRITPALDPERLLAAIGYIDRGHLNASALAARHSSPLAAQIERFEVFLDGLEQASATPREFLDRLRPRRVLSGRDGQAWQTLSEEIEEMDALAGAVTFERFRRLVSEVAGLRTIDRFSGREPVPGIPRVRILSPRALGYRTCRWLFAPGFADGEIPAPASSNPLLPDELIDELNGQSGARRLQNSRDRNRREPLHLFLMLDSAEEGVTLTCPGNTLEGEAIQPSIYISEILRHYGQASEIPRAPASRPRERGELLREVADAWRSGLLDDHHALNLLGEDVTSRARREHRGAARGDVGPGTLPVDVVFSPTELDKLAECPFVFLARHRLKLRAAEAPDFEVSPLEVGILAHQVLREFHSRPVASSDTEAFPRMEEIIERQLAAVDIHGQGAVSVIDPSLWRIRRPQLVRALREYARFAVRDARDGYDTLPEYLDRPLPAAPLGSVTLAGRPDHVAVRRDNGRLTGIRIDDFKYSAASSGTSRQLEQSFQIPVYAHLAVAALNAGPEVPVEGRYLLLRSPSSPALSHAVDSVLLDEIRERIESLIDKVRQGRLRPDPADRAGCKECDYRRLCRMYGA